MYGRRLCQYVPVVAGTPYNDKVFVTNVNVKLVCFWEQRRAAEVH